MPLLVLKLLKVLLGKLLGLAVLVAAAVGGLAAYLYVNDSIRVEQERQETLERLRQEVSGAYERLGEVHAELAQLGKRIEVTRTRMRMAKVTLDYLESFLLKIEYLFLTPEERREHKDKLERAQARREEVSSALAGLISEQGDLRTDRAEMAEKAKQLEERILQLETSGSEIDRYLSASWNRLKVYLPIALALLIFDPILWKLFAYYGLAPLVAVAKPIRFSEDPQPSPRVGRSGVSATVRLEPGERIWVRESFLQASDESLRKKTRFILDWRFPVSCLAAGLVELTELEARSEEGSGSLTVSTQDKPELELAVVSLSRGESMIIRPSFVAAVAGEAGSRVEIRRRWRFGAAQSWITLQFRYFEFEGPCRIALAGTRGVRKELIEDPQRRGRRANQDSTIGFTPQLSYGAARAETFWAYFRGFNPLFDDVFAGQGVFLCQEISRGVDAQKARRFWASLKDGLLKLLGV